MAQKVKSIWMTKLHESDLTQAVEGTTSFSFREVTLPTVHAATAKGKFMIILCLALVKKTIKVRNILNNTV